MVQIRKIEYETFYQGMRPTMEGVYGYVSCKLFRVFFEDGEKRRYLVTIFSPRQIVITKELPSIGFWRDKCATYECLSNFLSNGEIITRKSVIPADDKDRVFEKWVRENKK